MKDMAKKLNSRRGASLVLALLFLLFTAALGAVVITAASSSAGNTARIRKEQQGYFSVSSAANLVTNELSKLEFSAHWYQLTEVTVDEDVTSSVVSNRYNEGSPQFLGSQLFGGALFEDLVDRYRRSLPDFVGGKLTGDLVIVPQSLAFSAVDGMSEVLGTILVDEDFHITVSLWTGTNETKLNQITLYFTPSEKYSTEYEVGENFETTINGVTVKWNRSAVRKGGAVS